MMCDMYVCWMDHVWEYFGFILSDGCIASVAFRDCMATVFPRSDIPM